MLEFFERVIGNEELVSPETSANNDSDFMATTCEIGLWSLKIKLLRDIQIDHHVIFTIECQLLNKIDVEDGR